MAGYFVYILASKRNGTLYVGVTNHLARRGGWFHLEISGKAACLAREVARY